MLVLIRVDEKLVHGQVVVGWGSALDISRYIVIDDEIASDEWQADLVLAGMPDDITGEVHSVDAARAQWTDWEADTIRTAVLAAGLETVVAMSDAGIPLEQINVGGLRKRPGRKEYLPYVQLDETELKNALHLCSNGVVLEARDVPGAHSVNLCDVLRKATNA